jgi:hypothetical protein
LGSVRVRVRDRVSFIRVPACLSILILIATGNLEEGYGFVLPVATLKPNPNPNPILIFITTGDLEEGFVVPVLKPAKNSKKDTLQEKEYLRRERVRDSVDTCGGLPSKDNPDCLLQDNPHYSLKVNHVTG